jgi:hypothetical protein
MTPFTHRSDNLHVGIMNRRQLIHGWLPCALGLLLLAGCNQSPDRYEVTGSVSLDDKPLDNGVIYFEPQDGQGTMDGATITNGQYHIPRDKGLLPGKYRVTIFGGDGSVSSGKAEPDVGKPTSTPGKERVPEEYNTKSKVIKEVQPTNPNRFDFDIARSKM